MRVRVRGCESGPGHPGMSWQAAPVTAGTPSGTPSCSVAPTGGGLGIVLLQPATRERHLPGPLENFQIILVYWTNSIKIFFSVEKEGNLEKKYGGPVNFFKIHECLNFLNFFFLKVNLNTLEKVLLIMKLL